MLSADDLRALAAAIRAKGRPVDDALVALLAGEVRQYRQWYTARREQVPFAPLDELLPLMGWVIYEASLLPLWSVPPNFTTLQGAAADDNAARVERLFDLADLARSLPWPEYAPRALGAIRVAALVESKRDDEEGYDAAWALHEEARDKYYEFRDSLGSTQARERFTRDLDEVLLPLSLAETGTACRAAERIIGLWAEMGLTGERESARWTERMFRELTQGAAVGELALATAEDIERRYGLVHQVDEHRLSVTTSYRNPAIMTCRALLLLFSMCPEMQWLGRSPERGTWDSYRAAVLRRFEAAFAYLRREVRDEDGAPLPLSFDHLRSTVQLCLHLALLTPGRDLGADLRVDDTLTLRRLDDAAVEAMSAWLATIVPESGRKRRGDANTVGSASKPSFIASLEACRVDAGGAADYRGWRRRWPELDRYDGLDGRRDRIAVILRISSRPDRT
jgi:hypothetical protein